MMIQKRNQNLPRYSNKLYEFPLQHYIHSQKDDVVDTPKKRGRQSDDEEDVIAPKVGKRRLKKNRVDDDEGLKYTKMKHRQITIL